MFLNCYINGTHFYLLGLRGRTPINLLLFFVFAVVDAVVIVVVAVVIVVETFQFRPLCIVWTCT